MNTLILNTDIELNRRKNQIAHSAPYSSKIIKASALLPDTKTLLAHWDTSRPTAENLDRFSKENIFGKASRTRVENILAIFRRRYLQHREDIKALVRFVHGGLSAPALDKILFFHTTQSDPLLHDFVVDVLEPLHKAGRMDVRTEQVQTVVAQWVNEGKTAGMWGENTQLRVAQGLVATLRDFGILEGAVNKRIAPTYLPLPAFAYIAFYLKQYQPSGEMLTKHPEWRLFFLAPEVVERFFVEAHQHHLLEYHAAGTVIRIDFPAATLSEYADVILERTY